jgi:hypothetical protein
MKGILHGWDRIRSELLVTSEYLDLTEIIMGSGEVDYWQGRFDTPDIHIR